MSGKSTKNLGNVSITEQDDDDGLQNQELTSLEKTTEKRKKRRRVKRSESSMSNVNAIEKESETVSLVGKRPKVKRLKPRGISDVSSKDASKEQMKKKKAELKKITDEMFYTKLISGLIVGLLLGLFIFITDNRDFYVFVIFSMLALLLIVIYIRYIRKIPEEKLSWVKLYLSGTFTYLIVIIVVSSLVWMFLYYYLKGPLPQL